jgi:hypothetical protein
MSFLIQSPKIQQTFLKHIIICQIQLVRCVKIYLSEWSSSNIPLLMKRSSLQSLPQTMISSDIHHTTNLVETK